MLLILEIILTICAWRKGWGVKSLIPAGSMFVVAFIMGIFIGLANGNIEPVKPFFILFDIGAICGLIYMLTNPPVTDVVSEVVEKEETFKLE